MWRLHITSGGTTRQVRSEFVQSNKLLYEVLIVIKCLQLKADIIPLLCVPTVTIVICVFLHMTGFTILGLNHKKLIRI